MSTILVVSFYIKHTRLNVNNEAPIIIRLNLDDTRREISSKLRIKPGLWSSRFNTVTGTSDVAKRTNKLLEVIKNRLFLRFLQSSVMSIQQP